MYIRESGDCGIFQFLPVWRRQQLQQQQQQQQSSSITLRPLLVLRREQQVYSVAWSRGHTMSDRPGEASADGDEEEAPIISPREVSTTQQTKEILRNCGTTSHR